jgi:hypothetical protein
MYSISLFVCLPVHSAYHNIVAESACLGLLIEAEPSGPLGAQRGGTAALGPITMHTRIPPLKLRADRRRKREREREKEKREAQAAATQSPRCDSDARVHTQTHAETYTRAHLQKKRRRGTHADANPAHNRGGGAAPGCHSEVGNTRPGHVTRRRSKAVPATPPAGGPSAPRDKDKDREAHIPSAQCPCACVCMGVCAGPPLSCSPQHALLSVRCRCRAAAVCIAHRDACAGVGLHESFRRHRSLPTDPLHPAIPEGSPYVCATYT